jgi:two-component system, NarL family, nitrate/nitrite response regulator NarL
MAGAPHSESVAHEPLRVLVIDAHPAVGLGLVRLVGIMPGVQVCGLVTRSEDGLACAGLTRPDVALVDAELPGDAALATIRKLRARLPTTRVVALGLYAGRRAAALAAGAHAFVLKDAGFEALRAAIVAGGVADGTGASAGTSSTVSDGDSASARTPGSVRSS